MRQCVIVRCESIEAGAAGGRHQEVADETYRVAKGQEEDEVARKAIDKGGKASDHEVLQRYVCDDDAVRRVLASRRPLGVPPRRPEGAVIADRITDGSVQRSDVWFPGDPA